MSITTTTTTTTTTTIIVEEAAPTSKPHRLLHLPQWRIPKSLSVSPYLRSRKDRAALQKAAYGTKSGPTGAEVDAFVASTLTRKEAEQAAQHVAAEAEPSEAVPAAESEPAVAEAAATVASDATQHAEPTTSAFAELPRDEKGRRVGLEDENDPQLQDDPAVFAVTPQALPQSKGPVAETVQPTSTTVPSDLVDKVKKATFGRQTVVKFISPPTVTDAEQVILPESGQGFVDPRIYGGSSFDLVGNGENEPLNVIISGLSSAEVLTKKGFQTYLRSLDFDKECLGLHKGEAQKAWTDPRGWRDEEWLFRKVYTPFDHLFGTCIETLVGGNHFRAWQQQGTGAWFLATSKEENLSKKHKIIPDGYNIGRDELVKESQEDKHTQTSFFGKKYRTRVEYVAGLMPPGKQGVNHDISVDGLTAILTVTIVSGAASTSALEASIPASEGVPASESNDATGAVQGEEGTAVVESAEATRASAAETAAATPAVKGARRKSLIPDKTKQLLRKLRPAGRNEAAEAEAKAEAETKPATTPAPTGSGQTLEATAPANGTAESLAAPQAGARASHSVAVRC